MSGRGGGRGGYRRERGERDGHRDGHRHGQGSHRHGDGGGFFGGRGGHRGGKDLAYRFPIQEAHESQKEGLVTGIEAAVKSLRGSTACEAGPFLAAAHLPASPAQTLGLPNLPSLASAFIALRSGDRTVRGELEEGRLEKLASAKPWLGQLVQTLREVVVERLTVWGLAQRVLVRFVDAPQAALAQTALIGPHSADARLPLSLLADLLANVPALRRLSLMEPEWASQLEVLRLIVAAFFDEANKHDLNCRHLENLFRAPNPGGPRDKQFLTYTVEKNVLAQFYYGPPKAEEESHFEATKRLLKVNNEVSHFLHHLLFRVIKNVDGVDGADIPRNRPRFTSVPEDEEEPGRKMEKPKALVVMEPMAGLSESELEERLPSEALKGLEEMLERMEAGQLLFEDMETAGGLAPLIGVRRPICDRLIKLAPAAVSMTDLRAGIAYTALLRRVYDSLPEGLAAAESFAERFWALNGRGPVLSSSLGEKWWASALGHLRDSLADPAKTGPTALEEQCRELLWFGVLSVPETLRRTVEWTLEAPAALPRLTAVLRRMPYLGRNFTAYGMPAGLAVLGRLGNHNAAAFREPTAFAAFAVTLAIEQDDDAHDADDARQDHHKLSKEPNADQDDQEPKEAKKSKHQPIEEDADEEVKEEEPKEETKQKVVKKEVKTETPSGAVEKVVFVTGTELARTYASNQLGSGQSEDAKRVQLSLIGRLCEEPRVSLTLYPGRPGLPDHLPKPPPPPKEKPKPKSRRYMNERERRDADMRALIDEWVDRVVKENKAAGLEPEPEPEPVVEEAQPEEEEKLPEPPKDCLVVAEVVYRAVKLINEKGGHRGKGDQVAKAGICAVSGLCRRAEREGLRLTVEAAEWLKIQLQRHLLAFPAQPLVAMELARIWPEGPKDDLTFLQPRVPASLKELLPKRPETAALVAEEEDVSGGALKHLLQLFALSPVAAVELARDASGGLALGDGGVAELESEVSDLIATSPAFAAAEGWLEFLRLLRMAKGAVLPRADRVEPGLEELRFLGEGLAQLLNTLNVRGKPRDWRQEIFTKKGAHIELSHILALNSVFGKLANEWLASLRKLDKLKMSQEQKERMALDVSALELKLHRLCIISRGFNSRLKSDGSKDSHSHSHSAPAEAAVPLLGALSQMKSFLSSLNLYYIEPQAQSPPQSHGPSAPFSLGPAARAPPPPPALPSAPAPLVLPTVRLTPAVSVEVQATPPAPEQRSEPPPKAMGPPAAPPREKRDEPKRPREPREKPDAPPSDASASDTKKPKKKNKNKKKGGRGRQEGSEQESVTTSGRGTPVPPEEGGSGHARATEAPAAVPEEVQRPKTFNFSNDGGHQRKNISLASLMTGAPLHPPHNAFVPQQQDKVRSLVGGRAGRAGQDGGQFPNFPAQHHGKGFPTGANLNPTNSQFMTAQLPTLPQFHPEKSLSGGNFRVQRNDDDSSDGTPVPASQMSFRRDGAAAVGASRLPSHYTTPTAGRPPTGLPLPPPPGTTAGRRPLSHNDVRADQPPAPPYRHTRGGGYMNVEALMGMAGMGGASRSTTFHAPSPALPNVNSGHHPASNAAPAARPTSNRYSHNRPTSGGGYSGAHWSTGDDRH